MITMQTDFTPQQKREIIKKSIDIMSDEDINNYFEMQLKIFAEWYENKSSKKEMEQIINNKK